MELRHEQFGIVGDRGSADRIRIELVVRVVEDRTVCVPLHEESVGSLARVFAGQLRQGNFRLPVAVKIQRDTALTREQSESVAAKFDTERAACLRVHPADAPPRSEVPVVRYYDLAPDPASTTPAVLPPSVLCRHAKHALRPRCPGCGAPLRADEWAPTDDDRCLACDGCGRRFSQEKKHDIARATARHDVGCSGCEVDGEECRRSAHFLNFFPARVLGFDLLDLDLEDYLLARQDLGRRARHPRFWATQPAFGSEPGDARLAAVLELFGQLLAGVRHLHRLGIAHLDLKPRNICLAAAGRRLDLRVIDLGFATDPQGMEYLRQAQGDRRLDTEYASPEVRSPSSQPRGGSGQPQTGSGDWVLSLRPRPLGWDDPFDPLVLPGDEVEVMTRNEPPTAHRGVIRQVRDRDDTLFLLVGWTSAAPPMRAELDVRILKRIGPGADLFSLGMILLALLTDEPRLRPVYDALPGWVAETRALTLAVPPSSRQLVVMLRQRPGVGVEMLRDLAARLERFGPARRLAEELLGVAVRLVLRVPDKRVATYLGNRNGDAAAGLDAVERDVATIRQALDALRAQLAAEADQRDLRERAAWVREQLERMPPGVPVVPGTRPPAFDRERIDHALRMAREPGAERVAAVELLDGYGRNRRWLAEHLERYVRPEGGTEGGSATETGIDNRVLVEVMRLGRAIPTHPNVLRQFTDTTTAVGRMLAQRTDLPAPARTELQRWAAAAGDLVEVVGEFDAGLLTVSGFFDRVSRLFFRDLERQRNRERSRPVEFRLGPGLRPRLGDAEALRWLRGGRDTVAGVRRLAATLDRRFETAHGDWVSLPPRTQTLLGPLAEVAWERRAELRSALTRWEQEANELNGRLSEHYQTLSALVLAPWDRGCRPSFWDRVFRRAGEARVVLGIELLEATEKAEPAAVLERFRELHLGPVVMFLANTLLDEARVLRELYPPEGPPRTPAGII